MVNVVVVVVVMIRCGSLGSVDLLDWEKRKDERFCAASSVVNVFG